MRNLQFALFALGLVLAAASAQAQTIQVKAAVPFNFIVKAATLPAGDYMIQSLSVGGSALAIRSLDQEAQTVVLANSCASLDPSDKTKLVFRRYGGEYFLAEIWVAGNNSGHQLPKSRREAEMAMNHKAEEVTVVAALR